MEGDDKDADRRSRSTMRMFEVGPASPGQPAVVRIISPAAPPEPSRSTITPEAAQPAPQDAGKTNVEGREAELRAEIERLKRALAAERNTNKLLQGKLTAAKAKLANMTRIALASCHDAKSIIDQGTESLLEAATKLWEDLREAYKEGGIEFTGPAIERFQAAAATLGLNVATDEKVETLIDEVFEGCKSEPSPDDPESAPLGDRKTQVGHQPPHEG